MIHIGDKIRLVVKENGITVAELARRINKTGPTIYNIFERESIDTDLLMDLGEALNHDFFQYYKPTSNQVNEDPVKYGVPDQEKMYLSITINNVAPDMAAGLIKKINHLLIQ